MGKVLARQFDWKQTYQSLSEIFDALVLSRKLIGNEKSEPPSGARLSRDKVRMRPKPSIRCEEPNGQQGVTISVVHALLALSRKLPRLIQGPSGAQQSFSHARVRRSQPTRRRSSSAVQP